MRWIAVAFAVLLAPGGARAAEPDTQTIGFGAAISSLDPLFHTLTPDNQIVLQDQGVEFHDGSGLGTANWGRYANPEFDRVLRPAP